MKLIDNYQRIYTLRSNSKYIYTNASRFYPLLVKHHLSSMYISPYKLSSKNFNYNLYFKYNHLEVIIRQLST